MLNRANHEHVQKVPQTASPKVCRFKTSPYRLHAGPDKRVVMIVVRVKTPMDKKFNVIAIQDVPALLIQRY